MYPEGRHKSITQLVIQQFNRVTAEGSVEVSEVYYSNPLCSDGLGGLPKISRGFIYYHLQRIVSAAGRPLLCWTVHSARTQTRLQPSAQLLRKGQWLKHV
ncbi:hypothetical protein SRHO_G00264070 [Serrasalmus rhombeus]